MLIDSGYRFGLNEGFTRQNKLGQCQYPILAWDNVHVAW